MFQRFRSKTKEVIRKTFSKGKSLYQLPWKDKASYIIFGLSLPWTVIKALILAPVTFIFTMATFFESHQLACKIEKPMYKIANGLNRVEQFYIMVLSYLFIGPSNARGNYQANQKVIKLLEDRAPSTSKPLDGQLSYNLLNAGKKEGWFESGIKLLMMWSFLPTIRHSLLNNPYLFTYSLVFTNQMTKPIPDTSQLSEIMFSYIGDPEYLQSLEQSCGNWKMDEIGFTPNYFNNHNDLIVDHNNLGLQIARFYATNIYLDTVVKTPQELERCTNELKTNQTEFITQTPITLGQIGNECHLEAHKQKIPVTYLRTLDSRDRLPFLSLAVPYHSHYHVVTGLVQANIVVDKTVNGEIIEHPMLCLYHKGNAMQKLWIAINDLFDNFVMGYLSHIGIEMHECK